MNFHNKNVEPWKVTLVDTGEENIAGGRLKFVLNYVKDKEECCFTYVYVLSNINVTKLLNLHQSHNKLATLIDVIPPSRYGAL